MENKLIIIGYISNRKCYLNIPERDAIQRYIQSENISETEFELSDLYKIECIYFDDEFTVYDIWE